MDGEKQRYIITSILTWYNMELSAKKWTRNPGIRQRKRQRLNAKALSLFF